MDSRFKKDQSEILAPILNDLTEMLLALRNAFNRQDTDCLQEVRDIFNHLEKDLETARKMAPDATGGEDRSQRLQSIIAHLCSIREAIHDLVKPFTQLIRDGILFSPKGMMQTNYLFDHEAGIFRSMEDVFVTENNVLEEYVQEKIQDISQKCMDFATDHEARLVEGLCLPQATPVFLAVLDSIRNISRHEQEIIKHLQS